MSCVVLNGVREFPDNLTFVLQDGFTSVVPKKTKGLGGRTILEESATVSIKVLLKTELEAAIFLEWWATELNYGTETFTINIPYFGIRKEWTVLILEQLKETLVIGTVREIAMNLKVLDDIDAAIAANILICEEC